MALYLENQTFGGKAVSLSGLTNAAPLYFGSELGSKTSDTAAKAIDTSCARKYKDHFFVRVNVVEQVSGTDMSYVELCFYSLDAEDSAKSTSKTFVKLHVTKDMLNEANRTPIEVSIPSTFGRFVRLEVSTDATAEVSGSIIATIEETFL